MVKIFLTVALAASALVWAVPAQAQPVHQPAPATLQPSNAEADKFGDALAATQNYLERRWLVFQIRMLLQKMPANGSSIASLNADAQRLGTKGPTAQEWVRLDTELARETDDYLAQLEAMIRNPWANWPKDQSPTNYTNSSLIRLETIRLEIAEARQKNRDFLPAMARAGGLVNLATGFKTELFGGRDQIVEAAMKTIKMAKPTPPKR